MACKSRTCKFLVSFFISLLMPVHCFAQSSQAPFIPTHDRLIIIGQQQDAIDAYISNTGLVPGGFMIYTSIQNMEGLDQPADHGAGIINAQYYIHSYPHAAIQLALYMVGAIDDTLQGKYDDNILKLAKWMKNTDCPIYFRIGYEFDLPQNGYDPKEYQQVYRYIVDHLRALGVKNVAYVWHTACLTEGKGNYLDWYPGDDYVDWFAVSLFNSMQIATARQFFAIARDHNKQLMIAESTPAGDVSTRSKMEWYKHYFDFINDEDIKVVCYINCNWNSYQLFQSLNWGDSRVENDPEIKDMWVEEMNKGYLQYSLDLYKQLTSS